MKCHLTFVKLDGLKEQLVWSLDPYSLKNLKHPCFETQNGVFFYVWSVNDPRSTFFKILEDVKKQISLRYGLPEFTMLTNTLAFTKFHKLIFTPTKTWHQPGPKKG